jgi:hypothetical protein
MTAKSVFKKLPPPPLHTSPNKQTTGSLPRGGGMITVQYIIVYDPGCYTTIINKFTYSPVSRRLAGKYINLVVKYNNYNICRGGCDNISELGLCSS